MQLETLELTVENGIAIVKLNRPPMNPLSSKLFAELNKVVDELEDREDVRVLILTGAGEKAFAAGADINEMKDLDLAGITRMNRISREAMSRVDNFSKPTIAAVNGLALGGGLELALCCDFRILSENARVALPEINLGIIPGGGGTQRLQRLVGQAKAKEMLYFGDMMNAQDALACGLATKVVPLENLMDAAKEMAAKLAEKAPVALRMIKASLHTGAGTDLNSALTIEQLSFGNIFETQDKKEGMAAFVEKRKPVFKGR